MGTPLQIKNEEEEGEKKKEKEKKCAWMHIFACSNMCTTKLVSMNHKSKFMPPKF